VCKLESYVKVLEGIIVEILLPKYNQSLVKSGEKSTNLNRLVLNYQAPPIAALLQLKRR
jgi:hypothetical protein